MPTACSWPKRLQTSHLPVGLPPTASGEEWPLLSLAFQISRDCLVGRIWTGVSCRKGTRKPQFSDLTMKEGGEDAEVMTDSPACSWRPPLGSELRSAILPALHFISYTMLTPSNSLAKNFCLPCPCRSPECSDIPSTVGGHGRCGLLNHHEMVLLLK